MAGFSEELRSRFTEAMREISDAVAVIAATAIEKAHATGIVLVGAHKTWHTGMFAYYLECITAAGFRGLVAGSGADLMSGKVRRSARTVRFPIAPIAKPSLRPAAHR